MSSLHSGHFLWPALLTAALVSCGLTAQAQAEGFIDDASVNLNLRNYYINRNFTNPTYPQSKAEEWTQSFILDARSGFTQGTVGFGIDVLGLMAYKLDSGGGTTGTQLLPQTGTGSTAKRGAPDNFGRLGVAAKARISNTELKVGEWMVVLPILRSDDGRSLPQTFEGAQITAKEIEGLTLYGGQMRGVSWRNSSDMEDMSFGGATSDRFNFAGGEYTFNEKRTMVGVWNAQLKDIYNQQYINLVHSQALGDWTFGANLGYFIGKEDGSQRAGKLDNKTASGLFSARIGGNTFFLGVQQLTGETQWMRVGGTSGGTLANDMYNTSFDAVKERSWQVRYDHNFVAQGIPGFTTSVRYTHGDNIHTATTDNGKEWSRDFELAYTFQEGTLKDLNLRWRNSTVHRDYSNNVFDENRVIVSYPINLL